MRDPPSPGVFQVATPSTMLNVSSISAPNGARPVIVGNDNELTGWHWEDGPSAALEAGTHWFRVELREDGEPRSLEPQVFALLAHLVEHRDRLVTKDEIFEKLWDGRIVTDSTLASRVKSARQAVGDSGKTQRFIKTALRQFSEKRLGKCFFDSGCNGNVAVP